MEVDEVSQGADAETESTWLSSGIFDVDEFAPCNQNPVSAKLEKAIFGTSKNEIDRQIREMLKKFDSDDNELTGPERDILFSRINARIDERYALWNRELRWLRWFIVIVGSGVTWIGFAPEINFLPSISLPGNPFSGLLPFLVSRSNLILGLLGILLTLMGLLSTVRTPDPLSGERTLQYLQSVRSNQEQMQDILEQQMEVLETLQEQSRAIEGIESDLDNLRDEIETGDE